MRVFKTFFFVVITFHSVAQEIQNAIEAKPKLVVGIVVDQMRQEYMYRYYSRFGDGGFRRLTQKGFVLQNAHYNYIPTVTGAGHASVYTGTTPAYHGVIGNEWYDKATKRNVYCVGDTSVATVGSSTISAGRMSPHRLLASTITDELELATQKRSKVISISVKDRGAILSTGHAGDAAYWYDAKTGRFITSTFFMDSLPVWVERFNGQKLPDKYLSGIWSPLLPIEKYTESGSDNTPYEVKFRGLARPSFPYNLKELKAANGGYDLLSMTPFSDDLLTEMAKAALDNEKMGKDEWPDFLSISYSAPDKIGHAFGPNSIEIEDVYLRLDRNIEDLLKKLDQSVGDGNYLVFLTADHAVADVPQFLTDNKIPSGYVNSNYIKAQLGTFFNQYFQGKKIIEAISGEQIYLDHDAFSPDPKTGGVDILVAMELISNFLLQQDGIAQVYTKNILRQGDFNEGGSKGMAIRGYHSKRSGDISVVLESGWLGQSQVPGTTHGSPYTYDTHVPIIFYGYGVKPGKTSVYHAITDIAPTLSVLLRIKLPNACTGQPISELLDR